MQIKIGTRASKLALWQAHYVESQLQRLGVSTSVVEISTKGDRILDVSLSKIGSKGVFTEELETMLKTGEIDIAVHSAKDVQSVLDEELELIAFSEREIVNDVLVAFRSVDLNDKLNECVIGTSSTRRVAFLKHFYPHIKVTDMRGNLQTRIEKLQKGTCDAMILAYAGVHRMNYDSYIIEKLPVEIFTPPAGQGSVAIECAKILSNEKKEVIRKAINHTETEICIKAERMFLKMMEGGCSVPTFAYALWANEKEIDIRAGIISLDGSKLVNQVLSAPFQMAEEAGKEVANKVLQMGGKEILASIKNNTGV